MRSAAGTAEASPAGRGGRPGGAAIAAGDRPATSVAGDDHGGKARFESMAIARGGEDRHDLGRDDPLAAVTTRQALAVAGPPRDGEGLRR
ncbi:MAG: hypothetical protein ACLFTG_08150 [Alphaproteobacteria bacterium]